MMGHDSEREGEKKEKGIVISQKGSKERDMMAWPGRQAGSFGLICAIRED
jgi:hypothetical protein